MLNTWACEPRSSTQTHTHTHTHTCSTPGHKSHAAAHKSVVDHTQFSQHFVDWTLPILSGGSPPPPPPPPAQGWHDTFFDVWRKMSQTTWALSSLTTWSLCSFVIRPGTHGTCLCDTMAHVYVTRWHMSMWHDGTCLCDTIWMTYMCICDMIYEKPHMWRDVLMRLPSLIYTCMGWLWLVGSLKLQVSFAKEPCKGDDILQKRPVVLRSLLVIATP